MELPDRPEVSRTLRVERMKARGEEVFLVLDPERPSWAFVNRDGLRLLSLLTGERTTAEISEEIARRYGLQLGAARKIVSSFIEELVHARILQEMANEGRPPELSIEGLTIEVTKRCNLSCVHCYLSAGKPLENELSLEEIKLALGSARELGAGFISISGGEPLLRPDCLEILDHSASLGFQTTVGTNGTVISTQTAKSLAQLSVAIQVSLDGASREVHEAIRGKGSYDRVIEGLESLIASGMRDRIVLSFTPTKLNFREAPALIELALKMEIRAVQFTTLFPAGNARRQWDQLNLSEKDKIWLWRLIRRKAKEQRERLVLINECLSVDIDELRASKTACGIGRYLRIDPEGNVYPCQGFITGAEFCLGNLREHTLKDIVQGKKLRSLWRSNLERPSKIESCMACTWKGLCRSGCMANAYVNNGTIWSPDSCSARRHWIRRLFKAEAAEYTTKR